MRTWDRRYSTVETPFSNNQAQANAINNLGAITGTGFLLNRGQFTLLSTLNSSLTDALGEGVNDWGAIVGINGGSPETGFLLTPDFRW